MNAYRYYYEINFITQGDPNMSVEYLYQVDFDMLSHDFQTNLKVRASNYNNHKVAIANCFCPKLPTFW